MGDRAGYRVRENDVVSDIIRKQWKISSIEGVVTDVARTLLTVIGDGNDIGSGMSALRSDLDIGRLTAALYSVVYNPPFDSIETDPFGCDICDNGIYEIELVEWNHWKVWNYRKVCNYPLRDHDALDRELIAEVMFTEGKPLHSGMEYIAE